MLLLARVARPLLVPLAGAGGMTLTLYTLHVALRGTDWLPEDPATSLALQSVAACVLGALWLCVLPRGPLEEGVSRLSRLVGRGR